MPKDLMLDADTGDLVIDSTTKDLAMVSGADEIAQRIRATLDIDYGEMTNLAPDIGSDYSSMLGKHPDLDFAAQDMEAAVTAQVPEVNGFNSISFTEEAHRGLHVDFVASYDDPDTGTEQQTEGGYDIGS